MIFYIIFFFINTYLFYSAENTQEIKQNSKFFFAKKQTFVNVAIYLKKKN